MRVLVPIGRALFALVFLHAIISHFSGSTIDAAAAQGVPLAMLVVPLTGLVAFAGGVLVFVGYRARFGAFLLFCFLVPVTLVMHDFWTVSDAVAAAQQKAHFMKNLSLVGGTLLIMYFGSGPLSLDD
jgi:putative oxidoreductase